jgi:hypothetical protein
MDDDVDQMVSRKLIAMNEVVQAETDIGQRAVMGKAPECALKKLRQGKGRHRMKVVPDVDEIVHVEGDL